MRMFGKHGSVNVCTRRRQLPQRKNEHNIIRLVAANENTHDEKSSQVLLYANIGEQPTTQLLILSSLIASERSKTVIHHTPNH